MSVLATIAGQAGMTVIRSVLSEKLGDRGGELAAVVVGEIAKRAGVEPDALQALSESEPGRVIEAMREVEKITPELVALYAHEVQYQLARMKAEETEPYWMRAWRPGMMYLLGFFWAWNIVILHVANAIWKIALPPAPWDILITLTGMFMGLYMGGHTLLRALGKAGGK